MPVYGTELVCVQNTNSQEYVRFSGCGCRWIHIIIWRRIRIWMKSRIRIRLRIKVMQMVSCVYFAVYTRATIWYIFNSFSLLQTQRVWGGPLSRAYQWCSPFWCHWWRLRSGGGVVFWPRPFSSWPSPASSATPTPSPVASSLTTSAP